MGRQKSLLTRLSELIGGAQRTVRSVLSTLRTAPNYDSGIGDYGFYDRARRGKARGLEISGLLLKPVTSKITAWKLGHMPTFQGGNDAADEALATWFAENAAKVQATDEESMVLGDYYIVVNPDLTATILPPNYVTPIIDPQHYGKIIGWRVEVTYRDPANPSSTQTHRDDYYADRRVSTVITNSGQPVTRIYRNLIGRLPIVHVPNGRAGDEMFGRSEFEPLIPMLQKYGAVLDAATEGNIQHGRPTPVFRKLGTKAAVEAFWDAYGKRQTVTHADGTTEVDEYIDFDSDKAVVLGESGEFGWEGPQAFMPDVIALLQIFYYLLVEHSEIPEGFLGSAIQGSKASLDTQLIPLVKFIERRRLQAQGWVMELAMIVLSMTSLSNPSVSVEQPTMKWEDLTTADGTLTLAAIKLALETNLITRETALALMPLDVDNPAAEIEAAKQEADADREAFDAAADERLKQAERRASDLDAEDDDENEDDTRATERQKAA